MLVTVYDGNLNEKTVLNEISDYRYSRFFYSIGNFDLTILSTDPGEPHKIVPGDFLYVYDEKNGDDSLYVTTVSREKGRIKISGYDLKIMLNWRITLFPTTDVEAGTYGYDVRQGYTSDIIKGYIDYNLCEASDPSRQISNCYCAVMGANLGLADDTYMSRLQPLNEVVEALCANAGIGYKVTIDTFAKQFIVNIFEGEDRHRQIGFGTYIGNADSVKRVYDNTSERSTAWAVNGTGINDGTVTAVNLADTIAAGVARKETVVTVNCETDLVPVYAKHSAGNYQTTEEIDASVNSEGLIYDVGDIVIVYDDLGGYGEMRINAIEKEYSGVKMRKKLHFVDYYAPKSKEKTLTKLAVQSGNNKKDVIDQKLDGGSGASSSGLTIENAVVIQEADASYLLHEYTEVEYIQGNKIVYAGVGNQVIAQGYVCYNYDVATVDNTPVYASMEFSEPLKYYYNSGREYTKIEMRLLNVYPNYSQWKIVGTLVDGSEYDIQSSFNHYGDMSEVGFVFLWNYISPATTHHSGFEFPYGYAHGGFGWRYRSSSGGALSLNKQSANSLYHYMPFKSEAEYNAAVGLTYEPNTLTAVQETITEV